MELFKEYHYAMLSTLHRSSGMNSTLDPLHHLKELVFAALDYAAIGSQYHLDECTIYAVRTSFRCARYNFSAVQRAMIIEVR